MEDYEFSLENHILPKLLIGSSPFIGASQFKEKSLSYYQKFFLNPLNITDLLVYFLQKGLKGAHICLYEPLVYAVKEAYKILDFSFPVLTTLMPGNFFQQFEWMRQMKTVVVFLHAQISDRLDKNILEEFCKKSRKEGYVPGISTHNGGWTIPQIDKMGVDIKTCLVAFNKSGAHVYPSLESTLKSIKNTSMLCTGMKVLGAGEIKPSEAFPFAFQYVKAITVGMVTKEEIDECCESFFKIFKKKDFPDF